MSILKVLYHPLYCMNNYVLIWGDWLSCDPLRGSHDSQSPHIFNAPRWSLASPNRHLTILRLILHFILHRLCLPIEF